MTFAALAVQCCGQCALLLGWRPHEFWSATPAELACILDAWGSHDTMLPDSTDLKNLMEQFPDKATEVSDG